jgi:hypothetical protein
MQIYVHRPEGNLGPYSPEQLQALVNTGQIKADELAWREGLETWYPVSTLLGTAAPVATSLPPAPATAASAVASPSLQAASFAEGTRREYLNHEANLRSLGLLYYLGAFFWLIVSLSVGISTIHSHSGILVTVIGLGLALAVCALFFWMGTQMRRLDPAVIIPATIVAVIGLIGFPVGTIINGLILYLIHCRKGKFVFTPEYHDVMAATPEIKYKTSLLVKVLVGIILVVFIASILIALGSKPVTHP